MRRYDRSIWGWALYDWANSTFSTTVVAGFYPVFFKEYWSAGTSVTESTLELGVASALASLSIALLAPLLGAAADQGHNRKRYLALFMVIGALCTGGLYFIGKGEAISASLMFIAANFGFSASLVFYDALLINVAREGEYDAVSAFGFALGYLGGGLLFALNVAMTLHPSLFGLVDAAQAVRISFLTVAVWWLVFTAPLLMWVREEAGATRALGDTFAAGWRQLLHTLRSLRALPQLGLFLAAYWFYIDAVNTVISMAVDYGLALGLPSSALIGALLLTQFIGFPAAIVYGRLGERFGPVRAIFAGIGIYVAVVIGAAFMTTGLHFFLLAAVIGLVQGGVQSLSRSLYARLVPIGKQAEYFGFFNVMGKFAAVVGPLLVGVTSAVTGEPRLSLLSLLVLFAIGAALLAKVHPEVRPVEPA